MSEEDLEMKLSGIMQENQQLANSQQPQSSFQRILNGAGPTSS